MNKRTLDVAEMLARLPMFKELDPAQLAVICAGTRAVRGERGQVLFAKGDPARVFYVVLFGTVKLALSAGTHNEKVLQIVGPGETFGEAMIFLERPFPVTAECLSSCLLLEIAGEGLLAAVDASPVFARRVLAGMSQRLHELIGDVEAYSTRTAAQRLVGYLLNLCGASGSAHFPTSKYVVASLLNLTPEALSRILHTLTQAELIEVDGRHIRIRDADRLRAYV